MKDSQQVQGAAATVGDFVQRQVDERSTEIGSKVGSTAISLRSIAKELRANDATPAADLAESIASRAEGFGRYLQEADMDRLVGDAENLARRAPLAAAALGLLVGLSAARFLKASNRRHDAPSY